MDLISLAAALGLAIMVVMFEGGTVQMFGVFFKMANSMQFYADEVPSLNSVFQKIINPCYSYQIFTTSTAAINGTAANLTTGSGTAVRLVYQTSASAKREAVLYYSGNRLIYRNLSDGKEWVMCTNLTNAQFFMADPTDSSATGVLVMQLDKNDKRVIFYGERL